MIAYPKILGIVITAFVAGAFVASPELRAYAANTVFSTDIKDGEVKTPDLANNAVTAAKIKDGEVKAAEIATDSVGAAELQGVAKLLFGKCTNNDASSVPANGVLGVRCMINGVSVGDSAVATVTGPGALSFNVQRTHAFDGGVSVYVQNVGDQANTFLGHKLAVIVYDK
ncbi:MAG TPA: hypothetical protein VIB07_02235 [Nitrososphaera sp.]|jgi:hypothetical protein